MKKKHLIIVVIALLLTAFIGFKIMSGGIPVQKVELENVKVVKTVSSSGKVVSENEADLSFQSSGEIYSVYVGEGDLVEKGTLVAALSNAGPSSDLQSVKDSLDVAQADLDLYVENYSTHTSAVGGEDEYWIGYNRLQTLVNKAKASYQSQLATFRKTYIYAPFSGTIVDIYKNAGETVSASEAVVKLADLNTLEFEINVDQEDFGVLLPNQEAEITLDTYDNITFSGFISELPHYANGTTEEFKVNLKFDPNSEKTVYLGATGDSKIITESTISEVQALTFDQVIEDVDGKYFIWVVEDGKLKKMFVEVGLEGDLYTELKTDLSDVTIVTSIDTTILKDGLKVRLTN